MKISGNALRPGHVISHQNQMWVVTKIQHTQPGKGVAYMAVILKNIKDGTKKDERFRASEDVERLFIDEEPYDFLYQNGEQCTFMNTKSYEQVTVHQDLCNAPSHFLQPGLTVTIGFHENNPIYINLPSQVVLTIEEADPTIKGQTASSSYKPARLNNGLKIMVPPSIDVGSQIIVNTEDGTYVSRYKE